VNWVATKVKQARKSFREDSLFRNAVYLMSSTAIMSLLGFGFWIFIAHLYAPSQIGVASALISISLLISNLSFLGLNSGLVRFLQGSKTPSRDINAALITVGCISMLASAVYLALPIGGNLPFFTAHPATRLLFVVLMACVALNSLTDSVFIANRRAELHTTAYAVFGVVRLILPLALVAYGSLGIFIAFIAATIVSLLLSFVLMWRFCDYHMLSSPNWNFILTSRKYTTNNYLGVVIAGLPSQIMPSFIIARLDQANAAYYSMAWTMANLLYVVPSAITNSLLAESAHDPSKQAKNIRHAVTILTAILFPAVLAAVIVAPYLLSLFGPQYAHGGTAIFQILALGSFFIAANSIGGTIMNLEQRTGGIVVVQSIIAITTLLLAWLLIGFGLVGVGLAMLGGSAAGSAATWYLILRHHTRRVMSDVPHDSVETIIQAFLITYDLEAATIGADIGGGDRSATVIVESGDTSYVLKIYAAEKRSFQQITGELNFSAFLKQNGLPVPTPIPAPSGEIVTQQTLGPEQWIGVLMTFEEGHHPVNYSPDLLTDMAHMQAKIHRLGIEYARTTDQQLSDYASALKSSLVAFAPRGISHFDYDSSNVLVINDNVASILDFEGVRYDPVAVCLYFTLSRLYAETSDPMVLRNYLKAYRDVRPMRRIEKYLIQLGLATRFRTLKLLSVVI
jgi:O-antigen/teichoic acid export membrane protein/Ser/Thr protein kinase RdoA (MazF antagonist)